MTKIFLNHILFLFALQVASANVLLGQDQSAEENDRPSSSQESDFVVDGLFSIGVPDKDHSWRKVSEDTVEGFGADTYLCSKAGTGLVGAIMVEGRTVPLHQRRRAVKTHYQGLLNAVMSQRCTDISEEPPKFDSPVGNVVKFGISAVRPNGEPITVNCLTQFGKRNTFMIQDWSPEAEQAKRASIASTLRELGGRLAPGKSERYQHVGFGFSYQPPLGMKKIAWDSERITAVFRHPTGANVSVLCTLRPSKFDLESTATHLFEKTGLPPDCKHLEQEERGDLIVGGVDAKWSIASYQRNESRFRVIQYVFATEKWFFLFTKGSAEEDFQKFRPLFDAAMLDFKLE